MHLNYFNSVNEFWYHFNLFNALHVFNWKKNTSDVKLSDDLDITIEIGETYFSNSEFETILSVKTMENLIFITFRNEFILTEAKRRLNEAVVSTSTVNTYSYQNSQMEIGNLNR